MLPMLRFFGRMCVNGVSIDMRIDAITIYAYTIAFTFGILRALGKGGMK